MSNEDELRSLSIRELEQLLEIRRRSETLRRASEPDRRPERPNKAEAEDVSFANPARYQSRHLRPEPGHRTTQQIAAGEPEPRFRSMALAQITAARSETQRAHQGASRWRRLRDHVLLLIEVGAVVGLMALLVGGALQLRFLNQEAAEAMAAPTAEPAQILPGGSAPPTPAPLPGIYERLVKRATPIIVPTPGVQSPTRISIPKIGVDAPIVQGDGWEELKKGVGHHIGSANPGVRGNMVLSGHDDVFGEVFRDLNKLEEGDAFTVYTEEYSYRYVVKGKRIVEPTEVSVMDSTREPIATLITCYPYRVDTHRLVVFAELAP